MKAIAPIILDRHRLDDDEVRKRGGDAIQLRLRQQGVQAELSDQTAALLWDTAMDVACKGAAWRARQGSRKAMRTKPSEDPVLRRCTRVVAMVHELHKVGYQRLRILPFWSPSGAHWRCAITHAANVEADGFTLKAFDERAGDIAVYSSSMGCDYFNWSDQRKATARELAVTFLSRFPKLADLSQGRDWLYAGWMTDFLGQMEAGDQQGLIGFLADYPVDPRTIEPWLPPPPFLAT